MNVIVNGEPTEVGDGVTVEALVERLGHPRQGLAVAVDGDVVPKSTWPSRSLADGDRVEVLTASQGG